jgi:hypothetical protein
LLAANEHCEVEEDRERPRASSADQPTRRDGTRRFLGMAHETNRQLKGVHPFPIFLVAMATVRAAILFHTRAASLHRIFL